MHISYPFLSGIIPLSKVKTDLLIVKYFPFAGVRVEALSCNLDSLSLLLFRSLSISSIESKYKTNNNNTNNSFNTYLIIKHNNNGNNNNNDNTI